jgi:hypothetical protein
MVADHVVLLANGERFVTYEQFDPTDGESTSTTRAVPLWTHVEVAVLAYAA